MNSKKRNKIISKNADLTLLTTLYKLFINDDFNITPTDLQNQDDEGEDFSVELTFKYNNSQEARIEHFYIQNKGKENINNLPIKRNKGKDYFQFPLSIRNAERYYYLHNNSLIITLCDNIKNEVFWYAIQTDSHIEKLINTNKLKERENITISIPKNNILNSRNVDKFINEILLSKDIVNKRTNNRKDTIRDSIIEITYNNKEGNLIDNLIDYINQFEGMMCIPSTLFTKPSPFTLKKDNTKFDGDCFITDNLELIEFFETIEIVDNKYFFKLENKYQNENKIIKKITLIVHFLLNNNILHLGLKNEFKRRVCIHNLQIKKSCQCIKCLYNNYNLDKLYNKLEIESNNVIEEFKRGYIYTLLNKYYEAIILYKKLYDRLDDGKNPIIKLLCCYNISKLKKYSNGYYNGIESYYINENINHYDLDDNIIKLIGKLNNEKRYFLEHLTSNKFYERADWEISEIKEKIEEGFISDNYGGSSRNSFIDSLFIEWHRFYSFTNSNNIIYEIFHEFTLLKNKVTETALCSYSIKNIETSRIEYFNDSFNNIFITTQKDTLEYIFKKYDIEKLSFGESEKNAIEEFKKTFDNILISYKIQSQILDEKLFEWENFKNLESKLSSCLFLIKYIEIDNKWINDKLLQICNLSKNLVKGKISGISNGILSVLCNPKFNVNLEIQQNWFEYAIDKDDYFSLELIENFAIYLKYYKHELTTNNIKRIFQLIEKCRSKNCLANNIGHYIEYYDLFKPKEKNKFKQIIECELSKKFDNKLFYLASLYNVIDYKLYFEEYLKCIPTCEQQLKNPNPFGNKERNYKLNEFINLCFKFEVRFEKYQHFHSNTKYYKWLMNLDTFDYNEFNPYWLMAYDTKFYMIEFKKHRIIKTKLEEYLLKHKVKGLINIYIKNFANES